MIVILDRNTLVDTYRIMLRNSLSSNVSDQEIEELARGNYIANASFRGLRVAFRGEKASSTKYFRNYFTLQRMRNNVIMGLSSIDHELNTILAGYDNLLNSYFDTKLKLEKDLFTSIKKTREKTSLFLRFNNFKNQDLSKTNTLKHPGLIDYYFSRDNLCSTDFGAISLPVLDRNILIPKDICVEPRFSTIGSSVHSAATIKTEGSSHEYICKVNNVLANGAKLTYCLQMSHKTKVNQIRVIDSSISKADLTKIFVIEDGQETLLEYEIINKGGESICLLKTNESEYKKIYIEFTQHKYIDREVDRLGLRERIVNALDSSFSFQSPDSTKYLYQFNIDKIELQYTLHKKTGLFRLNETLDLANYDKLVISEKALLKDNMDAVETYLEVKELVDGKESFSVISPDNGIFLVNKYISGQLIYILNSGANANTGYITAIDIKAT